MEKRTDTLRHREPEQTTIRQIELLLIHVLTQQHQITVVLSVVKWMQLHRHPPADWR
jgi:hypothetical protein